MNYRTIRTLELLGLAQKVKVVQLQPQKTAAPIAVEEQEEPMAAYGD